MLALPDGQYLKIFHNRHSRLHALLWPAAKRFARNTQALREREIETPRVTDVMWLDRTKGQSACLYDPLPGMSLEQILKQTPQLLEDELPRIAAFILSLHDKGIYFRSLHLGNVLQLQPGRFGLIDVLDLRLQHRPLSAWQVRRNFDHLRNYLQRRNLGQFPFEHLQLQYQTLKDTPLPR